MRVISVQVGLPREILWRGQVEVTSIFKDPVEGPVQVRGVNLAGDDQSDRTVHGGTYKAVYGYASEHYPYWRGELPGTDIPYGMFGENLTTEGLIETDLYIGDRYRIGTVELVVAQPRFPCYKLGIRFGMRMMEKKFLQARRSGFYFSIAKEGELQAGDEIELLDRSPIGITISDIVRLYIDKPDDPDLLERAIKVPALSPQWKGRMKTQLAEIRG